MAKKRLAFEVEEDLHSSLKLEAGKRGVPMGSLCSSILKLALAECPPGVKDVPGVLPFASLTLLREEAKRMQQERPAGWERTLARLNTEISRRFRV